MYWAGGGEWGGGGKEEQGQGGQRLGGGGMFFLVCVINPIRPGDFWYPKDRGRGGGGSAPPPGLIGLKALCFSFKMWTKKYLFLQTWYLLFQTYVDFFKHQFRVKIGLKD